MFAALRVGSIVRKTTKLSISKANVHQFRRFADTPKSSSQTSNNNSTQSTQKPINPQPTNPTNSTTSSSTQPPKPTTNVQSSSQQKTNTTNNNQAKKPITTPPRKSKTGRNLILAFSALLAGGVGYFAWEDYKQNPKKDAPMTKMIEFFNEQLEKTGLKQKQQPSSSKPIEAKKKEKQEQLPEHKETTESSLSIPPPSTIPNFTSSSNASSDSNHSENEQQQTQQEHKNEEPKHDSETSATPPPPHGNPLPPVAIILPEPESNHNNTNNADSSVEVKSAATQTQEENHAQPESHQTSSQEKVPQHLEIPPLINLEDIITDPKSKEDLSRFRELLKFQEELSEKRLIEALVESNAFCDTRVRVALEEELAQQQTILSGAFAAKLSAENERVRQETSQKYSEQIEEIKKQHLSETQSTLAEFEQINNQLKSHETQFQTFRDMEQRADQVIQLYNATLQLSAALEKKRSFDEDLEQLRNSQATKSFAALKSAIETMPKELPKQGVLTSSQLRDKFNDVIKAREPTLADTFGKIWSTAGTSSTSQKTSERDYTDPVVRIDYYLSAGQVAQALKEAELLNVKGQAYEEFLVEARNRVKVERLVQLTRSYGNTLLKERQSVLKHN